MSKDTYEQHKEEEEEDDDEDEFIEVEKLDDELSDNESSKNKKSKEEKDKTKKKQKLEVFEIVSGRLAMMSNQTKYTISVDEVKRRMNEPECLNSSSLAGVLRRSKTKNGGEEMREMLKRKGIEMDLCKRKGTPTCSITGLCEGEMIAVANDLEKILKDCYPTKEIAKEIINNTKSMTEKAELLKDIHGFLTTLKFFTLGVAYPQPEITGVPPRPSPSPELNAGLDMYSCHTHGLGPLNSRVWLEQLCKIGDDMMEHMEKEVLKM